MTIVSSGTISGGTAGTGGSGTNGYDLFQSETGVIVTYSWYSADASEFTISTVAELLGFANLVNGTDLPAGFPENVTFEGKTVKLGADIDLSTIANWTPIGNGNHFFKGTFDGDGHTISNLTVNSTGQYDYVGMFGYIIIGATVKNLAVSGNVTGTGDLSYAGGIVGSVNGGSITNCSFSGSVTGDGNFVGGIVGQSNGTTVLKCHNTAAVSGSALNVGGIVGSIDSADILNCYNQGTVTSQGNNAKVGGIVGFITPPGNDIILTSCYSTGSISATGTNASIGGAIGRISGSYTVTIDDFYYLDSVPVEGIGSIELDLFGSITGEAVGKTSTAFTSGEVAWLLQNAVAEGEGQVWGQTLTGSNKDTYPVFANESGSNKVYKVTFKVDGKVDKVEYVNGGEITVTDPTAPNGYTFGGWYTAQTGGTQVTTITEDINLYARWEPISADAPTVSGFGAEVTYGKYTDKEISVTVTDKDEDIYTYSYQWYDSSKNKISGATETTYTIPNDLTAGSHDYYCVVTAKRIDNSETATTEKKITVKVNKSEQSAAPELVGKAETIDGKADGKITGVTSAMEYRKDGTTNYTAITGTEVTGLAVGKYYVRYKADNNYFASADTEVTVDKGRKMTVTVPTAEMQIGYTLTANKTELVWNDSIELTFALTDGYSKQDTFAVNVNGNSVALNDNGKCTVKDIQSDITITVVGVADITAPTGEITLGANSWKTFFNNITFGLFFKDMQEVTITATDNLDENVKIEYLLSDKELTADELAAAKFTAYSGKFSVEPNNKYVIYAKLSDNSGNVAYINSNGIVLDNVAPAVSGLVNGKTYCEAQIVTISDSVGVASVTVNGKPVILDANGQFTLNPAEGKQTVVAKDLAGNVSAEMIVAVNDGHEGGTATCAKQAKCKHCYTYYGQLDGSNHTGYKHVDAVDSTAASRGNVEYWYCSDCGKYYSDEAGKNEIDESGTYTYTITFNVGGVSFVADKINVKWDDVVLDGVDNPVKSGRVFEGWTCGGVQVKEDVSYGDFAKSKDVASIALNAQWRRVSGLNAQQPAESEIEAALAKFSFMARSAKTPNNNVKVVLKTDADTENFIKEWQDRGYVVKYQFYRSTNPKYGYREMLKKDSGSYINTMGIYGTKYYYKARVQVYGKDGKLIAQTGLKQCKYACRMWTK